ncbi:acetate uptake transporter [Anaeramoeba ignava]|uniref:Acetate uptake transporter n=1 Tax=Anaeramoeba ignava TaxID=1746090 RepID=A0A9Q0LGI4_ANAIG|nr:acetate uptake transporter [Anaeramoeba ignava]
MNENHYDEIHVEKEIKKPDIIDVDIKSMTNNIIDPSPIGVFGLAIGAWILSMTDFGTASGENEVRIAWIAWLPSIAQLLAGFYDSFRGNVFGATSFVGYAFYWFSLTGAWYAARDVDYKAEHEFLYFAVVDICFFIFTIYELAFALGINLVLSAILFFILGSLLSCALQIINGISPKVNATFLMIISLLSFWFSLGGIFNGAAGGNLIPMGPGLWKWDEVIINLKKKQEEKLNEKINLN